MRIGIVLVAALSIALPHSAPAQEPAPSPDLAAALRWRMIGPHRGGRTVAGVGVPSQRGLFYIGVNNGGVWKTTDYGRVWTPIFDDQPTGSVGAIAVAPSNPSVVYVGSGEGLQRPDLSTGDGIYKSTDAGKTWTHLGLRDGQQIPMIVVDPTDADRLFVAVLGHPYGPNEERGIFRSTDGGRSFQKVLYKDENTGGMDVALDPADPRTVYAVLWSARQAPWEIGGSFNGPGSGVFKSSDGGTTWRQLGGGLPTSAQGLGRVGIATSPSDPRRLYAIVDAKGKLGGLYRSDDAGEHWRIANGDDRLWGRGGDFNEVRVDPKNADVIYVANVVTWKSTDGGATFTALRGAPGGDDYHRLWIDPTDSRTILLTSDQGALVTVNGGETWSSWYNQPTAQFYHVAADNAFPYRVYGGQQESGSVGIASRGDDGAVTFREWHPVGVEEYGYAAPDPLDPNIVYGGKLTRFDWRTKEVRNVAPRALRDSGYRVVRTQPVVFSPADPHQLLFASNVVWSTRDGGRHWTQISPDLTRPAPPPVPANLGAFAALDPEKGQHRGVVYALAPSPRDARRIWAGTDDGLIHVTSDGGAHWRDVTPSALRERPWSKVSILEASHFDTATAYAAINTFRLDDLRPHVYRTRDGGRTWTEIVQGIAADGGVVNVVREDPARRGLLYAGSEREVYVSFDDGDHWRPLRLNMPATSIRDLVVKDDDIVVATHGRSFWILDDVTPLRQAAAAESARSASAPFLFAPARAWRVRWNRNPDTPIPQEEPAGRNPPDGAVIDYSLPAGGDGPVTLEVLDAAGRLVRRFASTDSVEPPVPDRNIPDYWIRPPQRLGTGAGVHRFVWDLRYPAPRALHYEYPISAIYEDTPRVPRGEFALPGRYTVRLTVGGRTLTQPLVVRPDPRVTATPAALAEQLARSREASAAMGRDAAALDSLHALRRALGSAAAGDSAATRALDARAAALDDDLAAIGGDLATLYDVLQDADAAPTPQAVAALASRRRALDGALARWIALRGRELNDYNARRKAARAAAVEIVVP
ncbi:MAG TPA: hypothetical protein VFJ74_16815 [Gemmatimonadaceae bacterium]|nr:hypothetical protein [Gemmatimonadaceae bacterium]